jgi:hypothetical protein
VKSQLNRWFFRASLWMAAIGFCNEAVTVHAEPSEAMKPLAIVTLSGYDEILKDVNFMGSLAGQPQAAQQLEMMLQMFTQNKGLAGLDKDRPLGLFVVSDGADFQGAICVPVTDIDALLEVLEPFDVTAEDQGNGTQILSVGGTNLFLKSQGEWAYLSPLPQSLENLPDDPSTYFAPLAKHYDIGIRIFVSNVPEHLQQMAVMQLSNSIESGLKQLPDENDQEYAIRKGVTQAQMEQLTRMIQEIDQLSLGIQLDGDEQRALMDVIFTAVEGTTLAKNIHEYSNAKTNYAGFFQSDAAMTMSFASKITPDESAQFGQTFGAIRKQVMHAIENEEDLPDDKSREIIQGAVGDFLDALKGTVEAGMSDGGAVLNIAPDSLTLVAGGFVSEPDKVESGLKKLAEMAKQKPKFPGVQWNADNHAGIQFHTISGPVPEGEKELQQLVGETLDMVVGIGEQSVYFALGKNCLDALKQVIDTSHANPGKSIAPVEMTISLSQIMKVATAFAKDKDKGQLEMISSMLEGESSGRDHVRLVLQPVAGGLRYRLEAEEGVLRAIGMSAMAAQAKGQGAQGQGF